MSPPDGVAPNFLHPIDQNQPLYIEGSLLLGIAIPFLLNRVYNKIWIDRKLTWDDCEAFSSPYHTFIF